MTILHRSGVMHNSCRQDGHAASNGWYAFVISHYYKVCILQEWITYFIWPIWAAYAGSWAPYKSHERDLIEEKHSDCTEDPSVTQETVVNSLGTCLARDDVSTRKKQCLDWRILALSTCHLRLHTFIVPSYFIYAWKQEESQCCATRDSPVCNTLWKWPHTHPICQHHHHHHRLSSTFHATHRLNVFLQSSSSNSFSPMPRD